MAKRRDNKRRPSRLRHIERKCDRILSELIILRQLLTEKPDIDSAIESLHRSARNMRMRAERERDLTRRMFHSLNEE